jgi:hypothetical protein
MGHVPMGTTDAERCVERIQCAGSPPPPSSHHRDRTRTLVSSVALALSIINNKPVFLSLPLVLSIINKQPCFVRGPDICRKFEVTARRTPEGQHIVATCKLEPPRNAECVGDVDVILQESHFVKFVTDVLKFHVSHPEIKEICLLIPVIHILLHCRLVGSSITPLHFVTHRLLDLFTRLGVHYIFFHTLSRTFQSRSCKQNLKFFKFFLVPLTFILGERVCLLVFSRPARVLSFAVTIPPQTGS